MSDYKFGDEVQILTRSALWVDGRYVYRNMNQHITLGADLAGLYYSYSDDIRRKPRTEKRMMQWWYTNYGDRFFAHEAKDAGVVGFTKVGEPFEQEFEVPSDE